MAVRVTVLCENTVGRSNGTIGEHGFSCFLETSAGNFLFDTGNGAGLLHNARLLGLDLATVQTIVLSHGHFDHAGGMEDALGATGPIEVVAHPEIFRERFWQGQHERRSNGMPFSRLQLENLGARFRLQRELFTIAPGVHFSGEIPRITSFESGDPHLVVPEEEGTFAPDPFLDDASLLVETGKGLLLLLGCAHAGMVNIMHHAVASTGLSIHAVLGGTHLAPADKLQVEGTLQALREFKVQKIGVSHCTGLPRAAQLSTEFPGRFFFASVGSVLEL
jgi:7,8-dihydropterin-6-yl-methyl-4-(beta-D-ribofuranosyl)aminobenzene 5'-phosphate synthase